MYSVGIWGLFGRIFFSVGNSKVKFLECGISMSSKYSEREGGTLCYAYSISVSVKLFLLKKMKKNMYWDNAKYICKYFIITLSHSYYQYKVKQFTAGTQKWCYKSSKHVSLTVPPLCKLIGLSNAQTLYELHLIFALGISLLYLLFCHWIFFPGFIRRKGTLVMPDLITSKKELLVSSSNYRTMD